MGALLGAGDGTIIDDRYRVEMSLGEGGAAVVERVVDESSGRRIALKRLLSRGDGEVNDRSRLRFRHEFHTMARLQHPCVVEVYDYGIADGVPYYTMELLEGDDLKKLAPLDPIRACRVLRDLAAALAFLHARGLVHRDVSPGNVRCTVGGRAKLIDFGVIATAGTAGEIAGTPPFMAPEVARGLPIDHRADLFGLGALAYWLLTRRHAYGVRSFRELESAWRRGVHSPSELAPDMPDGLDELVLSLLSLDPLGRPSTAAEVVDRLGAIADLEPTKEIDVVSGYLASAALVGRKHETARLRRRVAKLVDGKGSAVVIEAPSGIGKSRLLREVALEAQTAGATVVSVGSETGRGSYGVMRALSRELLAAAPADAVAAAAPHVGVIGRVLPELRARFEDVQIAPAGNPREDRMELQAELIAWIQAITVKRMLTVLVDDVQRCDEASAAVLASLAHTARSSRLLLVVGLRTDEDMRAADAINALRDSARLLPLRGLEPADTQSLARALFGDSPGLQRLAAWMHELSGGSPLHTIELARHLVDDGAIRYVDGEWAIAESFDRQKVPRGLREALDARVSRLSPRARAVAELVGTHGGEVPLELCESLAELPVEEVFAALDELEVEGVLLRTEAGYRVSHDGLREALLAKVDDRRRRELHLRIGETLAAGDIAVETEGVVGWHLLLGGEAQRGAELLEREAVRLFETQSFADAIPPFEACLEVYENGRTPRRRCLELRRMLVMAACISDRDVALRHADVTMAAFARFAGLGVAARVGKVLGHRFGLALGLLVSGLRWIATTPRRRGPTPLASLRNWLYCSGYVTAVRMSSWDVEGVEAAAVRTEPLAGFTRRIPGATYLLHQSFLTYILGRWGELRRLSARAISIYETDRRTPIPEADRKMAIGGLRVVRALSLLLDGYPKKELEDLARLDLRFLEVGALQVKTNYHRWRGEEDTARDLEAEAARLSVQLGSVWWLEASAVGTCVSAYAHNHDILGLKRSIEKTARLVDAGYGFQPYLDLARGEYYRERGDLRESIAVLESLLENTPSREELIHQPARVALAESMLESGQFERARELAEESYRITSDPDIGRAPHRMRSVRILALAEAELGDHDGAAQRLEDAIAEAREPGSPSVCGLLHEARARVALMAKDMTSYRLHLGSANRWFKPTDNPALIARAQRLADADPSRKGAARPVARQDMDTVTEHPRGDELSDSETLDTLLSVAKISTVLSQCATRVDRAERALSMLIEAADAASGFLFLLDDGELLLAAPMTGEEPPSYIAPELQRILDDGMIDSSDHAVETDAERPEWHAVVLRAPLGDAEVVVGAAALVRGALRVRMPTDELSQEIARCLVNAGDIAVR